MSLGNSFEKTNIKITGNHIIDKKKSIKVYQFLDIMRSAWHDSLTNTKSDETMMGFIIY